MSDFVRCHIHEVLRQYTAVIRKVLQETRFQVQVKFGIFKTAEPKNIGIGIQKVFDPDVNANLFISTDSSNDNLLPAFYRLLNYWVGSDDRLVRPRFDLSNSALSDRLAVA